MAGEQVSVLVMLGSQLAASKRYILASLCSQSFQPSTWSRLPPC